jgi:hypothetical protein
VLNGDVPLNELHIEIDDLCLKLLALHAPSWPQSRSTAISSAWATWR